MELNKAFNENSQFLIGKQKRVMKYATPQILNKLQLTANKKPFVLNLQTVFIFDYLPNIFQVKII